MRHLTDEQFEELVRGEAPEPAHLAECEACRRALAERQALRERLRAAFTSVKPEASFAERLRGRIAVAGSGRAEVSARPRARTLRFPRALWPVLAAAAAVLVVAVPLSVYLFSARPVQAASRELAELHAAHGSPGAALHREADPVRSATYLERHLGFTPMPPPGGDGVSVRGCCVDRFRDSTAGSYVLETPHGEVSLVVLRGSAEELGLAHKVMRGGHVMWLCASGDCNVAAIDLGDHSYCTVGEVPHDYLAELLLRMTSAGGKALGGA